MERFEVDRRTVLTFTAGALTGSYMTFLYERQVSPRSKPTASPAPEEETSLEETQSTDNTSSVVPLDLEDHPKMGSEDADVTIVYYSDFQCPFCAKFEGETLPQLEDEYILDSTDVQLVVKPLGTFGEDSIRSAQAVHSVWEQVGKIQNTFWTWYEIVSDSYNHNRNSGWASVDNLVESAASFEKINGKKLRMHLTEGEYEIDVSDDTQEARDQGLSGTPYFIIYGDNFDEARTISGAQPFSRFETIINHYLDD